MHDDKLCIHLQLRLPDRASPVCEISDKLSALSRMTRLLGKMTFQEYTDSILELDQPSRVNVRWYAKASVIQLSCLSFTAATAASNSVPRS